MSLLLPIIVSVYEIEPLLEGAFWNFCRLDLGLRSGKIDFVESISVKHACC